MRRKICGCCHGNVDDIIITCRRSVLEKGFGDGILPPDSDKFDCGMCVHASDVDFDGENELLLGTYGQVTVICALFGGCPRDT